MIFIRETIGIAVVLTVLLRSSQSAATFKGHTKFMIAPQHRGYENYNFKCLTNKTWTIPSTQVCDGHFDCPDGSDEKCYHGKCSDPNHCQCAHTKKCIKRHQSHLYLVDDSDSPTKQELHVKPGGEMILECPVSRVNYLVEMKWYRNDRGVPSTCQITTPTKTHPISRLRCLHMTQNDEGIYSCEHNYSDEYFITDAVVHVNNNRQFKSDSCYCFSAPNNCHSANATVDIENVQMFSRFSSPILLTIKKSLIIPNYTIFPGWNTTAISWRKFNGMVYYALSKEVIDMKLKLYGASFTYEFIPSFRVLEMSFEDAPLALMRGDGKVLVYYESGNLKKVSHYKRLSFTKHNWHMLQWGRVATSSVSEADVMKVLSKLEGIYVRVNYDVNDMIIENRGLDLYVRNFRNDGSGLPLSIGKCFCPEGYAGAYCEKCAVNYVGNPVKGIPCK